MKKAQIAVLTAIGIVGIGYPLLSKLATWNNGFIMIDVVKLLAIIPYAIWPLSIYAGMKEGYESKKALELNAIIVILLVSYTILSFARMHCI